MTSEPTRPKLVPPAGSVECHSHVYDPERFAYQLPAMGEKPHDWAAFGAMLARLGFDRTAIVQAGAYGYDNRCTLDAVERLGIGRTRAVVITRPDTGEAEYRDLHAQGARALRFFFGTSWLGLSDLAPMAARVAPLGWHVIMQDTDGSRMPAWDEGVRALPCPVIVDHLGRIPVGTGVNDPAFVTLLRWLELGHVYVKLSGFYYSSGTGFPYADDAAERVRALVAARPDRLLYGANWPHPNMYPKPDDANELDLLLDWVPDEATRAMILRDNPARLYFND